MSRAAGGALLAEFQCPEHAAAADLADRAVLLGERTEAGFEVIAAGPGGVAHDVHFLEGLDGRHDNALLGSAAVANKLVSEPGHSGKEPPQTPALERRGLRRLGRV